MTIQMKRPEKKFQDVKVTAEDVALFTLGIENKEFILPSERNNYLSDKRALALLEDIKNGKDVSNQDFQGINLKGADISGANFEGCNFSKACFYQTKAVGCNFNGAQFDDAYIEASDFSNSCFKQNSFKRLFSRNNSFNTAQTDEDFEDYLTNFDKFLSLIERGKIDIRTLSKNDLLCVDIRRLDLTKVDLSGIDLSYFALDGINLSGTYIDPKQLLSLKGLQKYYFDLRKTKDKKRKQMEESILKENEEKLISYAKKQLKLFELPKKILSLRPLKKEIEPDGFMAWPISLRKKEEKPTPDTTTNINTEIDETTLAQPSLEDTLSSNPHITDKRHAHKITTKTAKVEKVKFKTKG